MKSTDLQPYFQPSAKVLKWVGIVLVLSFVLDFGIRLGSSQFDNSEWQLGFMSEMIDRGIIPLIGLAFIYAATGFKAVVTPMSDTAESAPPWQDARFWSFVVASLLGLLFILLVPLHFTTTSRLLNDGLDRLEQQASQQELLVQQEQRQLQSIASSGQLDQLLQNPQLPPDQLAILQELKENPEALNARVEERLTELRQQKQSAEGEAKSEARTTQLRAGTRSLLLAVGFVLIGWTGLRDSQ
ncbi:hypothetical protein GS597_16420 [Synechococcales cyanobacterium C]|uniref:Uncharacterized protein n=1 Tax=Petrachloros mirabilis ULC683 TaxID=2781853 RepID=A0A8K2A9A5_9CYAN|nr:HpsJ family protein [Petrachloros mirabilis]NCJ08064.1 hypothetical protein [Petrachloros mirabilis ULC683]